MQSVALGCRTFIRQLAAATSRASPPPAATRMRLQFSANLNFLFAEHGDPLAERYRRASAAGFRAVEHGLPADFSAEQAAQMPGKFGMQVVLLNCGAGAATGGEAGCAALPGWERVFEQELRRTVSYAQQLDCKRIHLMAGQVLGGPVTADHHATYERNLRFAVEQLEPLGIVGLIEPICEYGVPDYYLHSYERAIELITAISSPSLRLMVDLYHLQHLTGNLSHRLQSLMPHIGHIQIAQVPNRAEPSSLGELNFEYIFRLLEASEYPGPWIGLEYRPESGTTEQGLDWLSKFGYTLGN